MEPNGRSDLPIPPQSRGLRTHGELRDDGEGEDDAPALNCLDLEGAPDEVGEEARLRGGLREVCGVPEAAEETLGGRKRRPLQRLWRVPELLLLLLPG